MSIFFLTKIEEKVFLSLSDEYESVTSLSLLAKLPRTTVSKALIKLESLGLALGKKVRLKNKHLFKKVEADDLVKIIDSIKESMLTHEHEKVGTSLLTSHNSSARFISGKKNVIAALHEVLSLTKGERVYTVQASGMTKSWIQALGEEEIVEIHRKFAENGLILVSVQGVKSAKDFDYSFQIKESFKGRLNALHGIPDDFFEKNTALYVYRNTTFFVDIENMNGLIMKDKLFATVLRKMIHFMSLKTDRIRDAVD